MSDEHHHDHHDHHGEYGEHGEHDHQRQRGWSDLLTLETWYTTVANIRASELPWHRTLVVAASNYWRKMIGLQMCCGNTGHPGC